MRIMVANDLLYYREVLACALRALRPSAEVVTVEPDLLDAEVTRFTPDLVLCDRVTARVEAETYSWVELYVGGEPRSTICVGGDRSESGTMDLEELVAVVDRVARVIDRPGET